jgi:predicted RNA-binding Zn ribbon-like protein
MVTYDGGEFEPVETMDLSGGDLCLDFANTGSGRSVGPFQEKLRDYGDLVTWAERVERVDAAGAAQLRKAARRSPDEAARVLERARELREALYRLFKRGVGGPGGDSSAAPSPGDLARVADEAAGAAAARRLVWEGDGYVFEWPESDRLEQLLWPVALSAVELLTSGERDRVKECAADNCNWLFLDMSRNRSRRWCDMKVCGNRAKARRFSARQKGGRSPSGGAP